MTADELAKAVRYGVVDIDDEIVECVCCCSEHTWSRCPARLWNGCRSGLAPGESLEAEEAKWLEHYKRYHGMTEEAFYA